MALTKYDNFVSPNFDRGSFSYVSGAEEFYPDSNQVNIFGTLYLPRVYGKDLTSFEIASSGSVAITLNDIHSFDLYRDNTLSNITLKTVSNDSLILTAGMSSNAFLYLDAPNSNVVMTASNDMTLTAVDTMTLAADTLQFQLGSDFNINAEDINLNARSNVNIGAQTGDIALSARESNVVFTMSNTDALLAASGSVSLYGDNSNVSFVLQTGDALLNASEIVSVFGGVDTFVGATSNVFITASNDSVALSANNGSMLLSLDHNTDTVTMQAGNQILLASSNQISLTSAQDSVLLKAAGENVYVKLRSDTSNLEMYAISNVTINADQKLLMTSINEASITAGDTISMYTSNNMIVGASNSFSLNAASNVNIETTAGRVVLSANDQSYIALSGTSTLSNIDLKASRNVYIASSNLTSVEGADVQVVATNYVDVYGTKNVFLSTESGHAVQVNESTSNILMKVAGTNMVEIYEDRVKINGNIQVVGTIDTVDITQSNLQIADKTISLAFDSNLGPLVDGPTTNSGAGMVIAGQYGSASNARSLTWNWNSGMSHLGTSNVDSESFWDLRGGQFRITHSNETKEVAFGFRINDKDELEIVKKTGEGTFKRIAKFGRTLI